ncbi:MAG: bifunctional phosphopantothenoylcysteine decarboxylase/phosphopantothenate--cysteine ligase CoaBC [Cyanobacteria bacterium SIG28]|nr:bifunctional phosphopantothenoylcysteine decarboxylase/phosphopantothenate--cysteine ligase CoaBC [Cyanobacteria bacterium SIG28]
MLENKTVLIAITGGIAAYKICTLIRLYKKSGANVRVIATPSALNFVTKLTLQTLSDNEVYVEHFAMDEYKPGHISISDEADIMVIAPATANTISKIANGICDNLLTSVACAFTKPILIAPAMNTGMWNNTFVQENIEKLKSNGYHILNPENGFLACGTSGTGRMAEVEDIYSKTVQILEQKQVLKGKKILITAGGTKEKIDPVRYITNCSSGKMGIALADTAHNMGAEVTLVSTFEVNKPYKNIVIETACEMEKVVKSELNSTDCVIMAAAVADYRIKNYSEQKIKKGAENELTLELVKNPDILKEISAMNSNAKIVGFCAESENLIENAKIKIQNKGCDYIVANDISRKDIGFSSDMNEVYILDKNQKISHINICTKQEVAQKILEKIFE